jgi:hypothetical protein
MYVRCLLVMGFVLVGCPACRHASSDIREVPAIQRVTSDACNSAAARIQALIAQGQFAEAEALIAEASAGGLISREHAARLLNDIVRLNMRLGQIPATLQRAKDFPSQLREYTLHEIEQMLNQKDFSLATQAQLRMAKKLILEAPRLMEKGGDL